jgi:hypothetical protein
MSPQTPDVKRAYMRRYMQKKRASVRPAGTNKGSDRTPTHAQPKSASQGAGQRHRNVSPTDVLTVCEVAACRRFTSGAYCGAHTDAGVIIDRLRYCRPCCRWTARPMCAICGTTTEQDRPLPREVAA